MRATTNNILVLVTLHIISFTVASAVSGDDTNKPRCSRPSEWIVQEENVCYGVGKRFLGQNPSGNFKIKGNRTLVALRLVHQSGDLTCVYTPEARWGCRIGICNSDCFTTLIQTPSRQFINMDNRNAKQLFSYKGFTIDDDVLVIKPPDWPTKVRDGDQYSIISTGGSFSENGIHCVNVEASFLL